MEWRRSYLDILVVPLCFLFSVIYHGWLRHLMRTQPRRTTAGISSAGRRLWVRSMMKDTDKTSVLVVQTLRNTIMSSTLMASTCVLLCSAVAVLLNSTHSVSESVYGAHGDLALSIKYGSLLLLFLIAFLFYSKSVHVFSQVGLLINTPASPDFLITTEYVSNLLDKGSILNTLGNSLFYSGLPLLLWIFGPIFVVVCSLSLIPVLYVCDVVNNECKNIDAEREACWNT